MKGARRTARASVKVFEDAVASAEEIHERVGETEEPPNKLFQDALSRLDTEDTRESNPPAHRESGKDINARLQFLAKMYATDKDRPFDRADDDFSID